MFITILTIIDVMIALLLIAVILVQQSKDGGFGGAPFGGAGEAVFGGQAADHLTKFTVVLATLFFVVTLTLAIITGHRTGGEISVVEDGAAVTEMSAPAKQDSNVIDKDKKSAMKQLAVEESRELKKVSKTPEKSSPSIKSKTDLPTPATKKK